MRLEVNKPFTEAFVKTYESVKTRVITVPFKMRNFSPFNLYEKWVIKKYTKGGSYGKSSATSPE